MLSNCLLDLGTDFLVDNMVFVSTVRTGLAVCTQETWGFTFTETIKAYWGRGSWGIGNFIFNTSSLHCHHQNDSALRWAVV